MSFEDFFKLIKLFYTSIQGPVLISFRWQLIESYIFSAPRIHPSRVSDLEQVPVVTSLPPAVDGHLRCFLRVSVQTIHWRIPKYPDDVQVRLKWWGEEGDGVLFRWLHPPGGGGGTAIYGCMGYIGMCHCEGYGFQLVYPRIGCINQSVWD